MELRCYAISTLRSPRGVGEHPLSQRSRLPLTMLYSFEASAATLPSMPSAIPPPNTV